jgi:hypothetical protein
MKTINNFGKTIEFNERFHAVIYIKNKELIQTKLYLPVTVDDADYFPHKNIPFSKCIRKLTFNMESGKGIIIGQTTKHEGEYFPAIGRDHYFEDDESEQAYLKISKVYSFWKVATKMNEILLIPKHSNYKIF